MVRVAFGGISHETNTFTTSALGRTELADFHVIRGEEVLRSTSEYTTGMLAAATQLGYECVGLLFGDTEPSGVISDAAFEEMRGEICSRLRASMPVDAVALEVHGAGVAESFEDVEGELVRSIRAIVGRDVPIVGAFDLHGNMSDLCAQTFDFVCCVHEYPHTDAFERGFEAVQLIPRLLGGLRTAVHLERVPTLLPLCTMCTQPGFPAGEMNKFMFELEKRPGVLDCTVFHGFPFADTSDVGTTVIVTTEDDADLARSVGREAGDWIWRHREQFRLRVATDGLPAEVRPGTVDAHTARSAVAATIRCSDTPAGSRRGPVVVNEASDNTGAGAPGDSTHLLRAMLDAEWQEPGEACFAWMYDPAVVQQAREAGVGASFRVSLGGKIDPGTCGAPINAKATLLSLTDGRFDSSPCAMFPGPRCLGPLARLRIGLVDVLVAGRREQVYDYGALTLAGIDVMKSRVIGVKSSTHFRAAFTPIAARIITCEAPGWSSNIVEDFEVHRTLKVSRWPTDQRLSYAPLQQAKL